MYNVSDTTKIKNAYQDALYNENRKLKLSMTLNGSEVALENILDSISWEWDGFSSSGYTVGQIIYSKVNFSLYKDVVVRELMDVTFTISIAIDLDGVEQWLDIPFGKYKVAEVEQTKLQSRVTCYDKFYNSMQFIYVPLRESRQYTSTELCNEIGVKLGITIENVPNIILANEDVKIQEEDGTITTQTGTNFDGWTYAEILGLVAGACGGNFFFNRDGNLVFQKGFYTSDVSLTESQFTEPTLKPITYSKTGIKIVKRNDIEPIILGDILADNSPRLLALSNPLFTETSANDLLTSIKTISYQPIATTIVGIMPLHLEPLDAITITYESKAYSIPVFKLNYKFAGGLSGAIESYVSTDTETQSSVGGGLNSKINAIGSDVSSMQSMVASTIHAGEINASSINALNIKADKIEADVAEINNLVAGNLTTDNVHSMNITSEKFTVANGFITNAMINNVNANKINAGNINTSNVTIQSESGNLKIADNTLQIKDNTYVRVQIGKDAQNDYNLYLWDANGKLMWSATGLTEDAIKTQIIRDDMVKDNANISAGKLNIESLFTALNEDGSNTLNASKILLDTEKQTLEVAFDSMKTTQTELEETTQTLTTQLNVQQGNIETLVKETEIIKGEQTTIKDSYSQIEQDVNSISLTVAEVQSDVNGKVSQDSVISSINMSTEGIAISGDKLQLSGSTIIISNGESMTLDEYLLAEQDSENFLSVPNFNSGSLSPSWSWSVSSFIYVDTTYKHDGNTACRIKSSSASAISLSTSSMSITELKAGTKYKLSAWIYCESQSSTTGEYYVNLYGKESGATSSTVVGRIVFTGSNLKANEWTQLSAEITPTQNYTAPSVSVNGTNGGIDVWITDFELVQKGESLTQEQLINIINGSGDGFYLIDGQAYINAEYIQTGTMRADLIKVQVDGTTNLMPFNYVTLDNAINTSIFSVMNVSTYDTLGMYEVPYLYCQLPIFQGGASSDVMCTAIGYSDVEIEAGKDYYFMCEYLAFWGNDTKPDDGTGTSTATSGSKNGGLQNGQNMTLFLYNGDNVSQAKNNGYYQLATVYDFNASIKIEEREGYTGVYERAWTTLTARFKASQSYKGKLCINLDCSGFVYTGEGGSFYLRRLQLTDATQSNPVFIDYTKQVKEKHMELTDGTYYTNIVGVDGIQIENGKITGKYPMSYRAFEIDDNGFKCRATTGSENAFMGVNQSYYTYDGGSSGQITGYDDIYGFGCREIVGGTSEGIFVGVHHGFQKPNSTDYGRADIYTLYKDGTAFDTKDWTLLGEKVEPLGLVRRDSSCNIITQNQLLFNDSTALVNIADTNYDLGSLFGVVATTMIDENGDEIEVQQPQILTVVAQLQTENEELKAKNQELEERLARLEQLLLGE